MTVRSAIRVGQGLVALVAIAMAVDLVAGDTLIRLFADEQNRNAVVWLYDRDAAPGQTIEGRAWLADGGLLNVDVDRWIDRDQSSMQIAELGQTFFSDGERAGSFSFTIPANAAPGDTVDLDIDVWEVGLHEIQLRHSLTLVSRGVSVLHRFGKALLALGLLAGLATVVFALKRRALRRASEESRLWVIPAGLAGAASFVPLVEQATRLHSWGFFGAALVAWIYAGYAVAEHLNRRVGLARYTAVPLLAEMAGRGEIASVPARPVGDLETAWAAVGLLVRCVDRELLVTGPGNRFAIVSVPASELAGDAPLRFRASSGEFADLLVASASDVLGELRIEATSWASCGSNRSPGATAG